MSLHTTVVLVAAAGEQPEFVPERKGGSLESAVLSVLSHLDRQRTHITTTRGTAFVHIWFGELAYEFLDLFRFVGGPDECAETLAQKYPDIAAKHKKQDAADNPDNCAKQLQKNGLTYSQNKREPLNWIAT